MRLHHGPAVLRSVMSAVFFVFLFFFWGGGLEYGTHNRAEKCFDHQMSKGKICFIQTLYFYRVSNICITNTKFSSLPLTL